MGAFTAWWSSARFGWGRVWSSAAVSTEPFPAPLLGEVGGLRGLQADRGPLRSPPRGSRRRGPGPGAPRPASTSLNPRARLLEVRARGSRYVLAGYPTSSWTRSGRDDWAGDWGGVRDGPGAGRPISGRGEPSPGRVGPRSAWRRTPRASPRPPGAPGASLRNASPVRQDPPHLAPCELSVTESACARFAPAHLARCELR